MRKLLQLLLEIVHNIINSKTRKLYNYTSKD